MRKTEYMNKHGVTLRKVMPEERRAAKTDYQRGADYIIAYKGAEWYSKNGSLEDMKELVSWADDYGVGTVAVGGRYVFDSHGADSFFSSKDGEQVTVVAAYISETVSDIDLHDVGPMYRVRFDDGRRADCFADELIAIE